MTQESWGTLSNPRCDGNYGCVECGVVYPLDFVWTGGSSSKVTVIDWIRPSNSQWDTTVAIKKLSQCPWMCFYQPNEIQNMMFVVLFFLENYINIQSIFENTIIKNRTFQFNCVTTKRFVRCFSQVTIVVLLASKCFCFR